jgi:hypothetical protein
LFVSIWDVGRVLIRRWWNGQFGRLARRDVYMWASEDRLRWAVEARKAARTAGRGSAR